MIHLLSKQNLLPKLETSMFKLNRRHIISPKCDTEFQTYYDIPGPKPLPFIGLLHKYLPGGEYSFDYLHKNSLKNFKMYGPLVREQIAPGINLLHVYDPNDIEALFRTESKYPARRSHLALAHFRLAKPEVYNTGGLLATNGPEWHHLRSAFQKNITSPKNVKNFVGLTNDIADDFIEAIKQKTTVHSTIYDFLPELNRLYLEIIFAITFDVRLNSFSPEECEENSLTTRLIKAAFESNSGVIKLDKGVLWKLFRTPLYKKLASAQGFLEKVAVQHITERLPLFEESSKRSSDQTCLLDSFRELDGVDFKDIVGMCVDILMAAIDTTSYSSSFVLYHLANNKQHQNKLYSEVNSLLPQKETPITSEILLNASFVKACLRESLRLNPVSIGVGRVAQKDFILRDYLIPEGTVIVTQNMTACRLPQYCNTPEVFEPHRFLRGDPKYQEIHPFLSLPFGFGARSCIASRLAMQSMSIAIMKIIKHFEVDWVGGEMDVTTLLINKPDREVTLTFKRRE